jgi:hypothetical protein
MPSHWTLSCFFLPKLSSNIFYVAKHRWTLRMSAIRCAQAFWYRKTWSSTHFSSGGNPNAIVTIPNGGANDWVYHIIYPLVI